MFQWAYGATRKAKFDKSGILAPRTYALAPFGIPIEFAEPASDSGYWQGEKYFDHDLAKKAFAGPTVELERMGARGRHSRWTGPKCFIGVRLTDYLTPERLAYHGNLLETDYYEKAIAFMRGVDKHIHFVVFSDDIPACRRLFDPKEFIFCNPDTKPHEQIWLMSTFPYAIIANSSFHWWGAWLGQQEAVVAPKRWFVTQNVPEDCKEIVPDRWAKL